MNNDTASELLKLTNTLTQENVEEWKYSCYLLPKIYIKLQRMQGKLLLKVCVLYFSINHAECIHLFQISAR